MNKYKEYLGVEVQWRYGSKIAESRIVAGCTEEKGITFQNISHKEAKACLTPEYFGLNYKSAFARALEMIRNKDVDALELNAFAGNKFKIRIDTDGLPYNIVNGPTCPYE
jgi:hypothetical protein